MLHHWSVHQRGGADGSSGMAFGARAAGRGRRALRCRPYCVGGLTGIDAGEHHDIGHMGGNDRHEAISGPIAQHRLPTTSRYGRRQPQC